MEKIMSKISRNTEVCDELSEDKLDTVTGGSFALSNAVDAVIKSIGPALAAAGSGPPDVWVGFGWVPGW
jgi:hypothetical protein